ncbi:MAG: efflux RND transporter periplasmic adaptor subunit [Treponema sp.]|jgi:multidrug efflux pump subunit AcrA (membrane-fusion protein)|nr:efflux RND transporter periplasmic adaptor subunit [Treponema sp.]
MTTRVVSIVIGGLIVFFAVLIGLNLYWGMRRGTAGSAPVRAAGQGAGGGTGGGRPGAGGIPGGGQGGPPASPAGRTAAAVQVTEVTAGTIENNVVINGDILAASQVSIFPTVGGKLTQLRYQVGDWVNRGQTVATVDPSRPGEEYSESPVVSTIGGTVLSAPASLGDTVSPSTAVYVIGDLANLVVETFVPERFSNTARRGLEALVSLEALPGETFPATVQEVSPVLDPATRTLRIRLRFNQRDSRIRAGMFATVSLVTNARVDVPVIPRSAVINTYGSWIVFVVDNSNVARRRTITPGLENETSIEVQSGLDPGERIVSAGQNFLSDGDPVRIIE